MFNYNHERFGSRRELGLKYLILTGIYQQESTGAMVMDRIEQISMGFWKPSPGTVYPLLHKLVSQGYLELKIRSGKKYYTITEKGRDLINNSWFPWKNFMHHPATSMEKALDEIEVDLEYLSEKSGDVKKNKVIRGRLKKIIDRMKKLQG